MCSRSPTRPSARSPRSTSRPSRPTRKRASARASAAEPRAFFHHALRAAAASSRVLPPRRALPPGRPRRACSSTARRSAPLAAHRGGGSVGECQRGDAYVRRWGTSSLRTWGVSSTSERRSPGRRRKRCDDGTSRRVGVRFPQERPDLRGPSAQQRVFVRRVAPLLLLAACGARSGLEVDAAAVEASTTDGTLLADTPAAICVNGPIALPRSEFVAVLAVDRSNSMTLELPGNPMFPRRWDVLRAVLPNVLAEVDGEVSLGALFFPADASTECAGPSGLTVPFARSNAASISRALNELSPTGRTPTFAALVQAERLLRESSAAGARAVILATDGGPNCNVGLDGNACFCAANPVGVGQKQCRADPTLCLDDARAVAQVEAMAQRGVATFVIGIDGEREPELVSVLRRMAVAGGRPNPSGGRGYYSVQRAEDLADAVRAVNRSLSRCTLRASVRPPARATLTLRVGGQVFSRDAARIDGWDWSTPTGAELLLAGRACEAAARGEPVTLDAICPR
ncbi:MAG: vWA domain-containing protein [Polyangiales bacterium]